MNTGFISGAVIVTANMNDIASLEKALDGANAMFLTTHYWEDKTKEKEIVKVTSFVENKNDFECNKNSMSDILISCM